MPIAIVAPDFSSGQPSLPSRRELRRLDRIRRIIDACGLVRPPAAARLTADHGRRNRGLGSTKPKRRA